MKGKWVGGCIRNGVKKGGQSFIWLSRVLIPISFAVEMLEYSGLLGKISFVLEPVMGMLSLPARAAIPIVAGLFTGIYAAIAAMAPLNLTQEQMTLVAIFLLIAHALPQETIIQKMTGMGPLRAGLGRLATAFVTVMAAAAVMDPGGNATGAAKGPAVAALSFGETLWAWGKSTTVLCLEIMMIIVTIMILLEVMREREILPRVGRWFSPAMRVLGLEKESTTIWLTAAVFGLMYGSAVIIEEMRQNTMSREEFRRLHYSIGVNHAMIEDPGLFLAFGLNPLWLWIPRLLAAILLVHLVRLWCWIESILRTKTTS